MKRKAELLITSKAVMLPLLWTFSVINHLAESSLPKSMKTKFKSWKMMSVII